MSPAAIAQADSRGAAAPDGKTQGGRQMEQQIADNDARQALLESEELNRIKLPESTRKTEVLVKHIRDSVQKDSVNATNVLRTWISEPETKRAS
jgi:flagellar biosynthesis/type III secretory pathway M-ring protein FliF/YscJ